MQVGRLLLAIGAATVAVLGLTGCAIQGRDPACDQYGNQFASESFGVDTPDSHVQHEASSVTSNLLVCGTEIHAAASYEEGGSGTQIIRIDVLQPDGVKINAGANIADGSYVGDVSANLVMWPGQPSYAPWFADNVESVLRVDHGSGTDCPAGAVACYKATSDTLGHNWSWVTLDQYGKYTLTIGELHSDVYPDSPVGLTRIDSATLCAHAGAPGTSSCGDASQPFVQKNGDASGSGEGCESGNGIYTATATDRDGRQTAPITYCTDWVTVPPNCKAKCKPIDNGDTRNAGSARSTTHSAGTPGVTTRVSVGPQGEQTNDYSASPSISGSGQYVAFSSVATTLVAGDTNGQYDIFVKDRVTGAIDLASVSSTGEQGNGFSYWPSLSADGRYIAFSSLASNLVPGDTNNTWDVFLHDRVTGETHLVSVSSTGERADADSLGYVHSISADGRYVTFNSAASNLVAGDSNGAYDAFVHDRSTSDTERVSVDSLGMEGNGESPFASTISADGRYVVFPSAATNLVFGDTNGWTDVFIHDRQTGTTERASVSSAGEQGRFLSDYGVSSADGRFVAFQSSAYNLVPDDTNQEKDVFVHDRVTGKTVRVSVSSRETQASSFSQVPSINSTGRYVTFWSAACDLVRGVECFYGESYQSIYLRDLGGSTTTLMNQSYEGVFGNATALEGTISDDGASIAFYSDATNLVPDDTNTAGDIFVRDR